MKRDSNRDGVVCHEDDVKCGRCSIIIGRHHINKTKYLSMYTKYLDWSDADVLRGPLRQERPIPFRRIAVLKDPISDVRCDDCHMDEKSGKKLTYIMTVALNRSKFTKLFPLDKHNTIVL